MLPTWDAESYACSGKDTGPLIGKPQIVFCQKTQTASNACNHLKAMSLSQNHALHSKPYTAAQRPHMPPSTGNPGKPKQARAFKAGAYPASRVPGPGAPKPGGSAAPQPAYPKALKPSHPLRPRNCENYINTPKGAVKNTMGQLKNPKKSQRRTAKWDRRNL